MWRRGHGRDEPPYKSVHSPLPPTDLLVSTVPASHPGTDNQFAQQPAASREKPDIVYSIAWDSLLSGNL